MNTLRLLCLCLLLTAALACGRQKTPDWAASPPLSSAETAAMSPDAQTIYFYITFHELLLDNKPEQAAQALEQTLRLSPTPELYLELTNLYWHFSRFNDALATLSTGIQNYPEAMLLVRALAKTYALQNRFDDAVQTLDNAFKTHPRQLELVREAAIYRMEERRFGEAVDRLLTIPAETMSPLTRFVLGKAYVGLGLFDKAIAQFQQIINEDPEFSDAWVEMGLTYEAQKNFIDAEQVFAQLFDSGLDNNQIILRLIDLNLKLNNPDKALTYAQHNTDDLTLTLNGANLFLNQGFYEHAAQLLEPLAQEDPVPTDALLPLAILKYDGQDNPDQALAYLEAIPEMHVQYERALVMRIHILYQKNDRHDAKTLCLSAMKEFPELPEFPILLAEIHENEGEYAKALDVLRSAATKWPTNTSILYRLGMMYSRTREDDQAMALMEKIIALDPEQADALNFLGYSLAEKNRDLERAQVLIETALKIKPENGYFLDSLAWLYFKRGQTSQAWEEINRAVALADDPIIWEHFGDIAQALKFLEKARKAYSKALAGNGENAVSVRAKLKALKAAP